MQPTTATHRWNASVSTAGSSRSSVSTTCSAEWVTGTETSRLAGRKIPTAPFEGRLVNPLDVNAEFAWHFGLVIALAFLIGIEFHQYQRAERQGLGFGTTRTLTLV